MYAEVNHFAIQLKWMLYFNKIKKKKKLGIAFPIKVITNRVKTDD